MIDSDGIPINIIVTKASEADCSHAIDLNDGFEELAENLLADKV